MRLVVRIEQDSPLLSLAPELRNGIYEYAVTDTTSISVSREAISNTSPLSQVCRQIREEYRNFNPAEASKYAHHINVQATDFDHKNIIAYLRALPRLGSDSWSRDHRTLRFYIHLTNAFENNINNIEDLISRYRMTRLKNEFDREYQISFDYQSFNVEYARQKIAMLYECTPYSPGKHVWGWPRMEWAFGRAFARYDAHVKASKTTGRGEKRKAMGEQVELAGKQTKR